MTDPPSPATPPGGQRGSGKPNLDQALRRKGVIKADARRVNSSDSDSALSCAADPDRLSSWRTGEALPIGEEGSASGSAYVVALDGSRRADAQQRCTGGSSHRAGL